jgi:hypothetical protein
MVDRSVGCERVAVDRFELGPLGEAAIGNLAISAVDLALTPAAGFALGLAEEWLAPRLSRRGERYWLITRPLLMGHVLARLIARKRPFIATRPHC